LSCPAASFRSHLSLESGLSRFAQYDLVAVAINKSGVNVPMNGQRAPVLCHSDGGSFNDTIELGFSLSST
jgi:hypothetical protein